VGYFLGKEEEPQGPLCSWQQLISKSDPHVSENVHTETCVISIV
jgi:hypothetical protein